MYLKNIEVQGFKSFAQKINFEFHNGITAIVGPNGSGKSNVADAVRWVLGEQSAKQLRGGSMQDVIFSGTENRKPLSFASVAITLDNSDHKLPVDFQEVTVTRRLYRSGESEYLLNGSSCRLRDINEMFYDTGIGKEGYSIIGQGQIDRILSGKPEERRELFDEAAGIVKFKRRKNTTLKKLEEEQQNLVRVTDILSELTRQLGPLEKQSETAKIYLSRKENLKELDVNLFLLENNSREKVLEELGLKSETAGRELLETTRAYEKTKEEYDRLEKSLEELNEKTETLRAESQEKILGKQQLEGQIGVLEEQIVSVRQSEEHYSHRLTAIEEDTKKKEKDRAAFEEERNQYRGSLRKIREKTGQAQKNLARIQENVQQSSEAVEDGKNEIIELLNARSTTKGEARRSDTLMEQMEIRGAEISRRLLQLKTEEEQQRVSMEKARASLQEVTDRIKSMREEGERLDLSVASLGEELKKQNEQMDIGQRAYHREESRLESMRNMAERYDGYGNSIRRVMEQKKNRPGIRGVAADLIHVEKKYEIAIETALGGSIQNIVTDTQETAKAMIDFLKKNRYGRATFLPLDSISPRGEFGPAAALKETGVIGLACDLVAVEKEYQKLSRYLLGRVLVVDHIDHAIAIGRKYRHSLRMVTLEGESLSPGGSMTGGAFKNNSNLLGRRREIQELESSVRALKKDMEEMQVSIRENRDRRNALRESQANLQENLRRQSVAQNTAQILVRQLEEKDREIQKSRARVLREQEETGKQVRELRRENERIQTELAASRKDESELETYIEDRQRDLEKWKEEESRLSRELEEIHVETAALEQKAAFSQENSSRLTRELEALAQEREEICRTLKGSAEESREKEKKIRELRASIQVLAVQEEQVREKLLAIQREKEEQSRSHRAFFQKRDELSEKKNLLDRECERLRSQTEKLEEEKEKRISYMWEEYEVTPNQARQFFREEYTDPGAMKKQISKLREEIRNLGPVNVNAIEDYKELRERHTFLSAQYEDLKKAQETLQGIIQELDAGMRRQFTEKFQEIQREFDRAFRELFGGGRGSLELDSDADILEAGIRIISQPPGKKLQNMMQLSGGEKALTAIALLFAIQNLKPSPFCLLDEIEAALDDSNVGRFASYLQKLTKNTQFIIITHRRGTMNAADRLYGITMQEKGVSTLVSVDLVENQLTS